ncbi:multiple epidermal growth factor-like domains protein 10 [Haliotis rufescens]|uniref:multiple epidermal growth factor-like domains protein 10 n=1 Tax=Haliotis rufescens TaxID=6454 RepID=UPI00201EF9FE|nr:multiple epidermal growth factor-like domains protein 10 [Haliotis rufescens]
MAAALMIWIAYLMFAIRAGPCNETNHCSDCDNTTGYCLTGCHTGYYDQICSSECSDNCMNHKCVLDSNGFGNCTEGCMSGYQGLGCNIPCDSPGGSCTACPDGCIGEYCQLGSSCVSGCVDSSYGTDCVERHVDPCIDNQHCSDCANTTGHCLTECDTGYFDPKCRSICSDNCKNEKCTLLNNKTGSGNCTDGCVPGYQGLDCNISCDNPGDGCTTCPGGCEEGYCQLGSFCVSGCVDSYYGTGCHEKPGDNGGLFTGVAIGLATSSFLFIVTISLVVFCRYCQRSRRNSTNHATARHQNNAVEYRTEDGYCEIREEDIAVRCQQPIMNQGEENNQIMPVLADCFPAEGEVANVNPCSGPNACVPSGVAVCYLSPVDD